MHRAIDRRHRYPMYRGRIVVEKIVSGGQTGADRAALDVAIELGLVAGGWIPRGRRAEDGTVPQRYEGLVEAESESYDHRTERNVRDSDATVVFSFGPPTGGSALTARLARSLGKSLLALDLENSNTDEAVARLRSWLAGARPRILNVRNRNTVGELSAPHARRAMFLPSVVSEIQ